MGPDLTPYVPRLVLSWAQDTPDARYRRIAGSMAFCDVSGFTAMSERLARQGKVGAEELTDILNAVFAELLERAADFGGSMLKYGGDAVLVFFWGDDHARRAVAATAAMRAGLRVAGKRQTSAGRVNLRMSVGVNSGEFDFFLVGTSHREFFVAGPAATLTCDMETTADAGQILLSPATAAALAPSQLGARKGDGVLLARAPSVPRTPVDVAARAVVGAVDPAAFVPVALRRHLAAGGHEPEHRQVTIGFLGFSHLDRLLAEQGGDAVADALDGLVAIVDDRFEAHGVTYLASDIYGGGGKIIAVAGAPTGFDNNDERLLRAMREIVDSYEGLPLHVGLNRGPVFTGDVGPAFRRTYTMLGDAVNTAARVMAKASDGEIRTMPAVLDRSATLFDVAEQAPFAAKGKKEPLVTFTVGAIAGRRTATGERLPLIGRDTELGLLLELAGRAADGDGSVAELVGEPGIGKTRLVDEFAETVDATVYVARCEPYEASTPFFAARQLVQAALAGAATGAELLAAIERKAPALLPWAPLLAAVLGVEVPATPEVEQLAPAAYTGRLHTTLTRLFKANAAGVAVFVVDDAQWLDAASTSYLDVLGRSTEDERWLLLLSRRPQDDPALERDPPVKSITVTPLSPDDSAALARVVAPRVLLPAQARRLAERSGGHPLFVQELARAAMTVGDVDSLPDTVDSIVAARIDELPPAGRERLRSAAVLGASFDVSLLRALIGAADLGDLDEFIDLGNGHARFRQALFQQVAYDGMPFRRRRALHASVARLLEAGGDDQHAEQLSLHHLAAQQYEDAWRFASLAGASAVTRYAFNDAVTFFERAVAAGRHVASLTRLDVARAWKDLGGALFNGGRLAEASRAYTHARSLAQEDDELTGILCLNESEVRLHLGRLNEALRWCRRGLRLVARDPERHGQLRCRLYLMMANMELHQGRVSGFDWADQAVAVAEDLGLDEDLAHALATMGALAIHLGNVDPVEPCDRALALYTRLGNRSGQAMMLNNLGLAAYYARDWITAADYYEAAVAAHTAAGFDLYAASSANNIGEILADQGRWAEAEVVLGDALAVYEAGRGYEELFVFLNLAVVFAQTGRAAASHELLDRAESGFRAIDSTVQLVDTHTRRAATLLIERRAEAALDALDAAASGAVAQFDSRIARLRGIALAQLGSADAALDALRSASETAAAAGDAYEQALADVVRADLVGSDELRALAQQVFDQLGVVAAPAIPLR